MQSDGPVEGRIDVGARIRRGPLPLGRGREIGRLDLVEGFERGPETAGPLFRQPRLAGEDAGHPSGGHRHVLRRHAPRTIGEHDNAGFPLPLHDVDALRAQEGQSEGGHGGRPKRLGPPDAATDAIAADLADRQRDGQQQGRRHGRQAPRRQIE